MNDISAMDTLIRRPSLSSSKNKSGKDIMEWLGGFDLNTIGVQLTRGGRNKQSTTPANKPIRFHRHDQRIMASMLDTFKKHDQEHTLVNKDTEKEHAEEKYEQKHPLESKEEDPPSRQNARKERGDLLMKHLFKRSLQVLHGFFTTSKYIYVALYSAKEEHQRRLLRFQWSALEEKAHDVSKLIRPQFPNKIISDRKRIDNLLSLIERSMDDLMEVAKEL
jgi:hypothetical protein